MHLLTGAVMLTAALSAGPTATAAKPPVTAAPQASARSVASMTPVTANPVLQLETTATHAKPARPAAQPIGLEQPAPLPLTVVSVLSGRHSAAALGERAPPRL